MGRRADTFMLGPTPTRGTSNTTFTDREREIVETTPGGARVAIRLLERIREPGWRRALFGLAGAAAPSVSPCATRMLGERNVRRGWPVRLACSQAPIGCVYFLDDMDGKTALVTGPADVLINNAAVAAAIKRQ
jgi:hypothetical protein